MACYRRQAENEKEAQRERGGEIGNKGLQSTGIHTQTMMMMMMMMYLVAIKDRYRGAAADLVRTMSFRSVQKIYR